MQAGIYRHVEIKEGTSEVEVRVSGVIVANDSIVDGFGRGRGRWKEVRFVCI